MPRICFLIVLLLFTTLAFAGSPVKQKAVLKTDSAAVNVRAFDSARLEAYNKLPEFQYRPTHLGPSYWTRFWRWFWHWISTLFNVKPSKGVSPFWMYFWLTLKYLVIASGIGALVFIILKLVGLDMFSLFRGKPVSGNVPYSELLENIHEINFDEEIEKAVNSSNYRLAVRLLYLKSLKQLSDAGLIDWQINKTNSAYVYELGNETQRQYFKQLTYQFEYVWYGEFLIDQRAFQQILLSFQQFKPVLA